MKRDSNDSKMTDDFGASSSLLDIYGLPPEIQHRIMPDVFVSQGTRRILVCCIFAFLLVLSYFTGPMIRSAVLVLPFILLTAWYDGFLWSATAGIVIVLARLAILSSFSVVPWPLWISVVNSLIAIAGILGATWFVARAGRLTRQIRLLQGVLWSCFYCGRIRDHDEWISLQRYVEKHSEAVTGHRICPTCEARALPKHSEAPPPWVNN
jgi:hypothetical protein